MRRRHRRVHGVVWVVLAPGLVVLAVLLARAAWGSASPGPGTEGSPAGEAGAGESGGSSP
jgi:hypothetical protein